MVSISAHETVLGQALSTAAFIVSITRNPLAEFAFTAAYFSVWNDVVLSNKIDASQPCHLSLFTKREFSQGELFEILEDENQRIVRISLKSKQRYKLHLIVLDSTGNSKFLLFNNLAIQLIHHPCTELIGPNSDEIEEPTAIPLALKNLVGKTYLFKIPSITYTGDNSILSDAPEGSLMLSADSSQECEPNI
ncbi:hypothetical protein DY000_02030334 [Brassica cretica]|uniref:Replication factor A C-terminal domain-containing protein n=1 Tax=Brassica cretica TaxID=69181 RepID=A0ABQ7DLX7_BRACR|nr:hypothetical protein DY000_02030334 [Brassica cretica]